MRSIELPGRPNLKKKTLLVLAAHLGVGSLWGHYVAPDVRIDMRL